MTQDPTAVDNRPVTPVDLNQFSNPNGLLARKIAPHLTGEWTVCHDESTVRALLTGPQGESLVVYASDRRGFWEAVIRGRRPTGLPDEYGRFPWSGIDVPIETPPSQIAAQIEADLLPAYRTVLASVATQVEQDRADTARLRQRAEALAAQLGYDWHVKEHRDLSHETPRSYFTVRRPQQNKQIFGEFVFEHRTQAVTVSLCNVVVDPLDAIVEAVIRNQHEDPQRWKRWPKRLRRALLLMHQAGYSIDRIGPIHRHLFGEYLFKFDSHVGVGYRVVTYLRERPDIIEQVIRQLDPDSKGQ
jgi:hypothetical protein